MLRLFCNAAAAGDIRIDALGVQFHLKIVGDGPHALDAERVPLCRNAFRIRGDVSREGHDAVIGDDADRLGCDLRIPGELVLDELVKL